MAPLFDILDYPVVFSRPRRLTDVRSWHLHIPCAFLITALLRPRSFVELGTHKGDSYCAFCQAVDDLGLDTACTAVDHWKGDEQSGFYGEEVYEELKAYHDPLYARFSRLLRSTFDEAAVSFAEGSIDLLHLDGHHAYESVSHDFDHWQKKLSDRAVVLLHDTSVRAPGFGTWKLWEELSSKYPGIEFSYSNGLGVLAFGSSIDGAILRFFEWFKKAKKPCERLFSRLGIAAACMDPKGAEKNDIMDDSDAAASAITRVPGMEALCVQLRKEVGSLKGRLSGKEAECAAAESRFSDAETLCAQLRAELAAGEERHREERSILSDTLNTSVKKVSDLLSELRESRMNSDIHRQAPDSLRQEIWKQNQMISEYARTIELIRRSLSWRITAPLRFVGRPFVSGATRQTQGEIDRQMPTLELPKPFVYSNWYCEHSPSSDELKHQRDVAITWKGRPLITVIIPTYNSEPEWLDETLASIFAQSYPEWECLIVDDGSTHQEHLAVVERWALADGRFRLIRRASNGGVAAACQDGVDEAKGAYLCVVDHDDVLEPQALFEVASVVRDRSPDVIYSDEMIVNRDGSMIRCEFRPDFNYALLLSHPYIVHLTAFRKGAVLEAGGFDHDFRVSQDYDLLLRVLSKDRSVHHIPSVLYRWRLVSESTGHSLKGDVMEYSVRALNRHLQLAGYDVDLVWAEPGLSFNFFRVRATVEPSTVSVIIPTRNRAELLKACIDGLMLRTSVPAGTKLEIVVVDNGSSEPDALKYLEQLKGLGIGVIQYPGPFNFSALNNAAASQASGSTLLFLNNDIEVAEEGWLEAILELMMLRKVGVVGAKLIYSDSQTIQHAGVIVGFNGAAAHDHQFFRERIEGVLQSGHGYSLPSIRDCMAVTAACMAVSRDAFDAAGGFDERYAVGFGDTDLCLRIREAGYRCLVTPYARLIHHESATRGYSQRDPHPEDSALFVSRWRDLIKKGDPFYNSNLALKGRMFEPKVRS